MRTRPRKPEETDDVRRGGAPLSTADRMRMERVLGETLSDVRIHTRGPAAREVGDRGALAMTEGGDVAFAPGRYRPGTPVGDALLAHELTHVVQQREGAHLTGDRGTLEQAADRSATSALRELWGTHVNLDRPATQQARTGGRADAATQFMFCEPENRIERPDYLGPDSIEALDDIEGMLDSAELLQYLIVFGTVATLATSTPEETLATRGYDVEAQARALGDVEKIVIARIIQRIELLLISHENDMNAEEKAFWRRLHDRLGNL